MIDSVTSWLREQWLLLILGVVTLLILRSVYIRLRRVIRRRRPVRLHPKLQKYGADYGQPSEALINQRRAEAEQIVATSSTGSITGYEIIEQVEAVYVDGFVRPDEALQGLKAVAAMKGANAVTNVQRDRGSDRRCSASGDAVIVRRMAEYAEPIDDDVEGDDGETGGVA